jgi:hypothetical protein
LDARLADFGGAHAVDWDALVRASDDGWPFALSGWQRLILAVEPWALVDRSFFVTQEDRMVAVMPLQFDPASKVVASSGWGGCGPVVASGLSLKQRARVLDAAFGHAARIATELGARRLEFWLSPVTRTSIDARWGVNPFVFFGLDDASGLSQVIDLRRSEEELWRDVSETARHTIRRAREGGFVVEEAAWPEMVDEYYAMHIDTYTRTGVSPHPKAYFEGIAREMWPAKHSVLWVVRDRHGRIVGFHNALWFRNGAFYHTACSTRVALDGGANYLLFWHALLGAKTAGIRWYDCGEIAPGQATGKRHGLTTFKTRFGGEPHRFFKCVKEVAMANNETEPEACSQPNRITAKLVSLLKGKSRG